MHGETLKLTYLVMTLHYIITQSLTFKC